MPSTPVSEKPPLEIVIPDCCNIGVIFRALIAVNGAVLAGILLRTSDLKLGLFEFIETSMVVELACLTSLLALCALRTATRTIAPWAQRAACAAVPAAVTGAVIHFFSSLDWLWSSFANLTALKGMLAAAALGVLLQHYLELRMRAFSPVLVEARLQALQARIRPHFLYNSLNAVLSLIRQEPRRAETALEDLADLFRVVMGDNRELSPISREVELCRQYLEIEQLRLGDRLRVSWRIDKMPADALVPPLVLQPLLENAVYHGIEPRVEPGVVSSDIYSARNQVHAVLRNPYSQEGNHHGGNKMALNNIRERLQLHFDAEATLETRVREDTYQVHIVLPYVKAPT
jgi:two-component system sensor histidine kinase AlgZ